VDRPVVEILLPTHCRPHTIAYAIQSVLEQSLASFHLHVVGDGCDPLTEERVRAVADPRVTFHGFAKGPGYGIANRNRVLRTFQAPYVAYMTDDDLMFPDHLATLLRSLEEGAHDLVACRPAHVAFPDLADPVFFAFDWANPFGRRFLRNWFVGSATFVHRRSLFASAGYWNETIRRFADREFYNRARGAGAARYIDHVSLLRFYARHWDHHYSELAEPPQRRYLEKLRDPQWRDSFRDAARPGRRSWEVRRRQLGDFALFGAFSGPKFVRYCAGKALDRVRAVGERATSLARR
jgi:glycosyltransferase involved in cell wall biosynthesis